MLMQSLSWTADELLAFQRSQLSQLLVHARDNVPFYKDRLNCVFRSDGIIDWSRWTEIPILTKADLRDHGSQLSARRLPIGHGVKKSFYSSGSTGIPVKVTTTSLAEIVRRSLWTRYYALNEISAPFKTIKFWFTLPGEKSFNGKRFETMDGQLYGNRNLSLAIQLDVIAETAVTRLAEFTTTLVQLADENLKRRQPVRLAVVVAYGMGLCIADRVLLEKSFGARVLSPYSSKEGGIMAFQVQPDTHYVVCAEAIVPEFLPAEGSEELSRMIITPLFNAAQPLIRYDQGDLVKLTPKTYKNGALPVIAEIRGRVDDFFMLKGHRVPIAGLQEDMLRKQLRAKAFQVAQIGDNTIEVRYVAGRYMTPGRKAALTRHMRVKLQQDFDVDYVKLKVIPSTSSGKQQRFRREFMS